MNDGSKNNLLAVVAEIRPFFESGRSRMSKFPKLPDLGTMFVIPIFEQATKNQVSEVFGSCQNKPEQG
jgi:hypothetical protein